MLDEMKRKLRRLVKPKPPPKKRQADDARIPEGPQPGGPERPEDAHEVTPPKKAESYGVPVTEKEKHHDGYSGIRPRRPGEDTDMGRDIIPDITMPGRDLRPPDDDEDRGGTDGRGGAPSPESR